jgi:outer membrane protein assembly factor BamA
MRSPALAIGALLLCAGRGAAQLPGLLPAGSYLQDVYYPKLFYTSREGLTGGLFLSLQAPLRYEDYDLPPPYRASITLDGQVSTSGSRQIGLDARAPLLWDGWRGNLTLMSERRARESYFGIGNTAALNPANQVGQEFFYRSLNTRSYARGELQRRVAGGLRVLAGFHAQRARIAPLAPVSQLAADSAAGVDSTLGRTTSDVSVRLGLVFDTRDDEVAPSRGVLLEAIRGVADSSVAGEATYARTTVSARVYVPAGPRLIIAARVLGQAMTGAPTVGSYYLIEASDRPFEGIGGPTSHRGLLDHRLLGPDKLLANLDLRYTLYEIPTLARVSLLGFVDAGRVFPAGGFSVTTEDLKVGAGGGLVLKFLRAGVLGLTVGSGPDGIVIDVHTGWTF